MLWMPAAARAAMITEFGAVGDGRKLNTAAIQKAIDECARQGGTVHFPPGVYLSGTLVLRSNVFLHLEPGAVLRGSASLKDYPEHVPAFRSFTDTYTGKSLIYAEKIENAGILGQGAIDGQGKSFEGPYKVRPYLIRVISSKDITVRDVTIRDSPMWVQHYLDCDNVAIRGITVHSLVNHNNDGIDIDCCDRVRISDCDIVSGDDAIVLKSTANRVCRNVVVTNCVLSTRCNALKMGTESNGGFENITISNCTVYDTRLAGIALEIVDGGLMDGIHVSGITMDGVGAPIFIRLGNRARPFQEGGPKPGVGSMRNIIIRDVQARRCSVTGCAISGIPGHKIENVTLESIRLRFDGGGTSADLSRQAPENEDGYPEYKMFGTLPAYGLFVRHVKGLRLRDVELTTAAPDARPPTVFDDAGTA